MIFKRFWKRLFKPKEKVRMADKMIVMLRKGDKTWTKH